MKKSVRIALGACAVVAFAFAAGTQAQAKCTKASATGGGLGPEMAREMAKMNLDMAIAAKSMKARGKVSYKCSMPFMSECVASRRAC